MQYKKGEEPLKKTVRLADIAALTGLGIATVDRVLNERGNVSEKTSKKVIEAAKTLNLKRVLPTAHHKILRIESLLARPELPLISRIIREFGRQSERIDKSIVIQRTLLKSDDPKIIAKAIDGTISDGIVIYAQAHPIIYDAIERAHSRGIQTITIFSDLPDSKRLAYAGINHYAAGRTAGQFMAMAVHNPGPIIVVCHHLGFEAHASRVKGLRDGLKLYAPHLEIADVIEGGDHNDLSETLLRRAITAHGNVGGVYNVGAANYGCGQAIKATIGGDKTTFIGHELTDESRALLMDGTMLLAIDQYPEYQARFAIDVLLHHFKYTETPWMEPPYKSKIAFRLFSKESLPE